MTALDALTLVCPKDAAEEPTTWRIVARRAPRTRRAPEASAALEPGEILKRTRRRRRISLEQAAHATRIPRRYLEALERNAPASAFPAAAYARGFLRAYARYLGISEPDGLLRRLDAACEQEAVIPLATALPPPPARRRIGSRAAALALAAVLSIWLVAASGGPRPARPFPVADLGLRRAAAAVPALPQADEGPATGQRATGAAANAVIVSVSGGNSWLRVVVDGKPLIARVVRGPFEQAFSGDHLIEIVAGNAAAVRYSLAGSWSAPLGKPGEVKRITFLVRDGTPTVS